MIVSIINKSNNPLPEYKTSGSSGLDLQVFIEKDIILEPLERRLFPTGLYIELPLGYEAQIRPRSGLSIKEGISLVNCVGTIDSDYRGEIMIPLINLSNEKKIIKPGLRVAQMIISKYQRIEFEIVEKLDETSRGEKGFGSTGIN